jgi:YD repeat-containing protein
MRGVCLPESACLYVSTAENDTSRHIQFPGFTSFLRHYLLITCVICSFLTSAQTITKEIKAKTPEISSFSRNIETPVSYFTGIPNISIPLFEIKLKDLTIPITLNYNAGGIKVGEEATWVGLGWSLSYGGQISRKQRGVHDEQMFFRTGISGVFNPGIQDFLALPRYAQDNYLLQRDLYATDAKQGNKDFMPDEFYYSIGGYSGRFMLNQSQNKFVFFPKEDIKVNYESSNMNPLGFSTSNYHIDSWNMKLPNGVEAIFGGNYQQPQTESRTGSSFYTRDAWQVQYIHTLDGGVDFLYETDAYSTTNLSSESYSVTTGMVDQSVITTDFKVARIKTIGWGNSGYMSFDTTSRQDMPGPALEQIYINNQYGELMKTIKFHYSYFYGNYNTMPVLGYLSSDYKYKRLKLDSISIYNTGVQPLVYKFDYYSIDPAYIPSKFSYAQDFWGFYNKKFNTTLIPQTINSFGANRKVDTTVNNLFSLKSIVYPEGGKAEFNYEGNTATAAGVPPYFLEASGSPAIIKNAAVISVQGWDRNNYETLPDSTDASGNKYFKKTFTVPAGSYAADGNAFFCSSNFGGTYLDNSLNCSNNNVSYKLESLGAGTATTIKEWQARDCATNAFSNSHGEPLTLSPGSYRMTLVIKYTGVSDVNNIAQPHSTSFVINWQEFSSLQYLNVGGIRIKDIKHYTGDGNLASHKHYSYNFPWSSSTSGKLVSVPKFHQEVMKCCTPNPNGTIYDTRLYSGSRVPLQTTSGSILGYQYVTEEAVGKTPAQNLKTEYHFSFTDPAYEGQFVNSEEGVLDAKEWLRGKLMSVHYLKNNVPIKEEFYEYNQLSPHLTDKTAEDYVDEINTDFISYQSLRDKVNLPEDYYNSSTGGLSWYYHLDSLTTTGGSIYTTATPYFRRYTAFDKPSGKKTITYDDGGRTITENEHTFYERTPVHHQATKTEALNSKGVVIKNTFKYPDDMGANAPFPTMVQQNYKNTIVESEKWSGAKLLQKTAARYSIPALPDSIMVQLGAGPLETQVKYNAYDSRANILEIQRAGDIPKSYIYDYYVNAPIAEVVNAKQGNIAYTSFERSDLIVQGLGNWYFIGYAIKTVGNIPMGRYCFPTAAQTVISKNNLSTATAYIVSYWSTNGLYTISGTIATKQGKTVSGWTYYEHRVTGVTTISLSGVAGNIDDLRLYPAGALMTTYAVDEQRGVTQQCDINGRMTYYEYDPLGRLIRIRDDDKNIVKQYEYVYGEAVIDPNFTYYNVEKTVSLARNDCGTGVGSTVVYTVPANTYSSKVSQADADQKAQNDVNANAQTYANTHGICTFYSVVKSGNFIRGGCDNSNSIGSTVTYTVPAATYSSTISQADADQKAQDDVNTNGQNYANTNGTCIPVETVTVKFINNTYYTFTAKYTNTATGVIYTFNIPSYVVYLSTIGQLPMGTYNVNIYQPSGSGGPYNISVNGNLQTGIQSYTLTGLSVNCATCANMNISQ